MRSRAAKIAARLPYLRQLFIEVIFERNYLREDEPAVGALFIVPLAQKLEGLILLRLRNIWLGIAVKDVLAVIVQPFGIVLVGVLFVL